MLRTDYKDFIVREADGSTSSRRLVELYSRDGGMKVATIRYAPNWGVYTFDMARGPWSRECLKDVCCVLNQLDAEKRGAVTIA